MIAAIYARKSTPTRAEALKTGEAPVLALKERHAGRSKKGELWLWRQLEGLA